MNHRDVEKLVHIGLVCIGVVLVLILLSGCATPVPQDPQTFIASLDTLQKAASLDPDTGTPCVRPEIPPQGSKLTEKDVMVLSQKQEQGISLCEQKKDTAVASFAALKASIGDLKKGLLKAYSNGQLRVSIWPW